MLEVGDNNKMQSPFMEPVDSQLLKEEAFSRPDVIKTESEFRSITFSNDQYSMEYNPNSSSFLLMDANENMPISNVETFCKKLQITNDKKIKVVSIFGNTGDGKSHTLNHTFFRGDNVFQTSNEQGSCTLGVYGAMEHSLGVLCLDTEGLLGTTKNNNNNQTMRMLLKVLAVSDIIIYRTRSERLHKDMYDFLGMASEAFIKHFDQALRSFTIPGSAGTIGPAVIIFHETTHTKPLESSVIATAEDKLRENFDRLKYNLNAFSSLRYVGIRTVNNTATDYRPILHAVRTEIENPTIRSPRRPSVVFKVLKALNLKFSGNLNEKPINPFPEEYFTCPIHCEACNRRCQRSMGHTDEDHMNSDPCNYQQQYENKVYLCKECYKGGRMVVVQEQIQQQNESTFYSYAKYVFNGTVINCPHCGEIYRSRKYWYGNEAPEASAVRTQIVHVWKDSNKLPNINPHSAQIVVDSVSTIIGTLSSISSPTTKVIKDCVADFTAPSYWKPNHKIIVCFACKKNFEKTGLSKHHCRGCGEGFCNSCSQYKMPVPARSWNYPVRVCNDCREKLLRKEELTPGGSDETDILPRRCVEMLSTTINTVASAAYPLIQYPKEMIKDKARPEYWVSDADSPNCFRCKRSFGNTESMEASTEHPELFIERHHCRKCGKGVCDNCSKTRQPVPERGWRGDVRVCDNCANDDMVENQSSNDTRQQIADASKTVNSNEIQTLEKSDFEEFKSKND